MCEIASLAIDRPLPDDCEWIRLITNTDQITKDGTLHYQALKGAQFSPGAPKAWDHELSGEVACLLGDVSDIRKRGEERAQKSRDRFSAQGKKIPSKIVFAGVAFATAKRLQTTIGNISAGCRYTPIQGDNNAHADFTTIGSTDDASIEPIRTFLLQTLQVVGVSNLAVLVQNCPAPA